MCEQATLNGGTSGGVILPHRFLTSHEVTQMPEVNRDSPIVIVGAGCFGLSTAYHLLKRGFTNVTVLDRAGTLPAKDAASTDLNKSEMKNSPGPLYLTYTYYLTVVRSSYPDDFYTSLAQDAVKAWKDEGEWGNHYHEFAPLPLLYVTQLNYRGVGFHRTGVLIMGERRAGYTKASYANDLSLGVRLTNLEDEKKRKAVFAVGVELGTAFTRDCFAYLNRDGGWVHAEGGTQRALENVRALGGTVIGGKTVKGLVKENGAGRTTGVQCTDDSVYSAELVVLATGSWTPSTFPESIPQSQCLATGCVRAFAMCIYDAQLSCASQTQRRNHQTNS